MSSFGLNTASTAKICAQTLGQGPNFFGHLINLGEQLLLIMCAAGIKGLRSGVFIDTANRIYAARHN